MAPRVCRESLANVTSTLVTLVNHHPESPRNHCAMLCLGEGSTRAELSCLDLHCSFEALINAENRGQNHLDFAAQNYLENVQSQETGVASLTYERALRNLIVTMYGHYVDLFRCQSSTAGHRMVLSYNCLEVAAKLGRYHWAVRRLQPGEELPDWISMPEILTGDP